MRLLLPDPVVPAEKAFPSRAKGLLPWRRWRVLKVELVRFPFWAFPWSGGGPRGAWAVDALEGSLRLLHPETLMEGERKNRSPKRDEALRLPFLIDQVEAREIVARQAPLHVPLLRRAGLEALPSLEGEPLPILYPFWAAYLKRKDRLRPLLADAVTGAPGGPALIRSFLKGLASAPSGPPPGGPPGSPPKAPRESPGEAPG